MHAHPFAFLMFICSSCEGSSYAETSTICATITTPVLNIDIGIIFDDSEYLWAFMNSKFLNVRLAIRNFVTYPRISNILPGMRPGTPADTFNIFRIQIWLYGFFFGNKSRKYIFAWSFWAEVSRYLLNIAVMSTVSINKPLNIGKYTKTYLLSMTVKAIGADVNFRITFRILAPVCHQDSLSLTWVSITKLLPYKHLTTIFILQKGIEKMISQDSQGIMDITRFTLCGGLWLVTG